MTLAQIMRLALRQLDENPEDMGEYDDLFRVYANTGYQIAVRDYYMPREVRSLTANGQGRAAVPGGDVVRVIALRDREGRDVRFALDGDGRALSTGRPGEKLTALCEVRCPDMEAPDDEPRLPPEAHPALADYICYRHLSSGNLAKQSRAQFFLNSFYAAMRAIRPQGQGSVTGYRNLYAVTEAGFRR